MNSIQRQSRQHGRKDQEEDDEADLVRYLQWQQQNKNKTELLGHVTSLAVLEPFRRCGLAAQLMKQLHLHLQYQYNAKGVGLNVRIGNHAARKLYVDKLGYRVEDVLDAYYQDGEDAFFMRKDLPVDMTYEALYESRMKEVSSPKLTPESANNRSKHSSVLRRIVQPWWGTNANANQRGTNTVKNVWEHGPEEYRLPRMIRLSQPHSGESKLYRLDSANAGSVTDSSSSSSSRIAAADSMDLITTTSVSQKKIVANSM
jgi:GNAT superfamily N-acetyltransferase